MILARNVASVCDAASKLTGDTQLLIYQRFLGDESDLLLGSAALVEICNFRQIAVLMLQTYNGRKIYTAEVRA